MKLTITQSILGIVVIIAACFILAWMIFWTSPSRTAEVRTAPGNEQSVEAYPKDQESYTIARYASGVLLLLGIFTVFTSTLQAATKHPTVLASIQLSVGTLIAVTAAFITARGYPLEFVSPVQPDSYLVTVVNVNPGPGQAFIMILTSLAIVFGLAIVGVGIAQIIRSKKPATVEAEE